MKFVSTENINPAERTDNAHAIFSGTGRALKVPHRSHSLGTGFFWIRTKIREVGERSNSADECFSLDPPEGGLEQEL